MNASRLLSRLGVTPPSDERDQDRRAESLAKSAIEELATRLGLDVRYPDQKTLQKFIEAKLNRVLSRANGHRKKASYYLVFNKEEEELWGCKDVLAKALPSLHMIRLTLNEKLLSTAEPRFCALLDDILEETLHEESFSD